MPYKNNENRKEYAKNWWAENKGKYKERRKKWYREHKKEILKQKYEKYHTNEEYREKLLKKIRHYHQKNKEKQNIKCTCRKYNITEQEYKNLIKNGCMICGISDIVEFHGIDGNHNKKDLLILCSRHHSLITRHIIEDNIESLLEYYIN